MAAPGETDLRRMLATLDVRRRPGEVVYVSRRRDEAAPAGALAMIDEGDAVAYVVPADGAGAGDGAFVAAWLTLTVRSSLDAVGLTAAVATALAENAIPCNVLAGHDHDHLLVPAAAADAAIDALRRLRTEY